MIQYYIASFPLSRKENKGAMEKTIVRSCEHEAEQHIEKRAAELFSKLSPDAQQALVGFLKSVSQQNGKQN